MTICSRTVKFAGASLLAALATCLAGAAPAQPALPFHSKTLGRNWPMNVVDSKGKTLGQYVFPSHVLMYIGGQKLVIGFNTYGFEMPQTAVSPVYPTPDCSGQAYLPPGGLALVAPVQVGVTASPVSDPSLGPSYAAIDAFYPAVGGLTLKIQSRGSAGSCTQVDARDQYVAPLVRESIMAYTPPFSIKFGMARAN